MDTEGEDQEGPNADEIAPQSPITEHAQNDEEEDGFSDAPSQSASIHSVPEGSHTAALSVTSERFDLHRLVSL